MLFYYCSTATESKSSSNTTEGNVYKIRFLPTISPGEVWRVQQVCSKTWHFYNSSHCSFWQQHMIPLLHIQVVRALIAQAFSASPELCPCVCCSPGSLCGLIGGEKQALWQIQTQGSGLWLGRNALINGNNALQFSGLWIYKWAQQKPSAALWSGCPWTWIQVNEFLWPLL